MWYGFDRRLCDAAWDGDAETIRALLADPGVRRAGDPDTALMHAAHRGHLAVVCLLLGLGNPLARNSEALWRAARHRRGTCIDVLVPVCRPEVWERWQWDDLPAASICRIGRLLARLGRPATPVSRMPEGGAA
ncbi:MULTISPECIES: ankyrin repeat domain-containing protein [unclassified Luteibacter]|uniref:ankyrin repeat domain-containing protein n=1 Tax=Luteibacter sp. PvP019 TaxID=3156436 RepID=UPI0005637088